jgi:hypothetical protein
MNTLISSSLLLAGLLFGQVHAQSLKGSELFHALNEQLTEVIVTDGFSPPAAARIYSYANISGYEILVPRFEEYRSLKGQMTDFKGVDLTFPENLDNDYLLVYVYTEVGKELVYRTHLLDHFRQAYLVGRSDLSQEIRVSTEEFGNKWKENYMQWVKGDGYAHVKEAERYSPFNGPQYWEPTPPAYLDALEPNWAKLRPLVLSSITEITTVPPIEFDTVPGSPFYNQAMEVYKAVNELDKENEEIALFWDCNPLQTQVMGHFNFASRQLNPGGHWLNIVKITCQGAEFPLMRVAQIYALASIGMNDAFLLAWYEKYRSSLIRPVTYINRYIDPNWHPRLETPPFPEHPSAHSVVSTSIAVILTDLVGHDIEFIDDSEKPFGLAVRSFRSYNDAATEAAFSRLPGGIHYRLGITAGISTGEKMGKLVIQRVRTKK